jgi:membrane peptidoglycan carboxypeptidase
MTFINKSLLTNAIIAVLQPSGTETEQWFVGDHEKPVGGSWVGEPNRSVFVPYVVATALPSQNPTGPVGASGSDVNFPYAFTCMGDSRIMVERMSDIARERLQQLQRTMTSDGRTIGQVKITRYGGVDRLSREPPLYSITDQILFWTTG